MTTLKIISNGKVTGTKVFAGDEDISKYVSGVKWEVDCNNNVGARVTLTCPVVELEAEGELVDVTTVGVPVREFDTATQAKAKEFDDVVADLRSRI